MSIVIIHGACQLQSLAKRLSKFFADRSTLFLMARRTSGAEWCSSTTDGLSTLTLAMTVSLMQSSNTKGTDRHEA
jgi:hypothetical protein